MPLQTRLTTALGIEHPILLAPMDLVASGKLAAAVSHAGGDDTLRSILFNISRRNIWPQPYTGRVIRNAHAEHWCGHEGELWSSRRKRHSATPRRASAVILTWRQ